MIGLTIFTVRTPDGASDYMLSRDARTGEYFVSFSARHAITGPYLVSYGLDHFGPAHPVRMAAEEMLGRLREEKCREENARP